LADENRELLEAMEELRRAMGTAAMTAEELEEAQKQATVGMKAFQKASKQAAGNLAKGLGSFAKQVGEGDTSLKSLNKVVDVTSDALGGMAKAIPFAGEAIAAGVKAVGEASKFVLNQLDATAKVFNDFGKVGALGTKGMSGVFEQFNRSGMSLKGFQQAVQENAQSLARFRGMTASGAEDFSKIVGGIVDSDAGMELRRIGLSADQIGESTGAFVAQQTRLGRSQQMTQQQLTAGTVQYVKELDELSKVTGQSREAIQKQQDAALSESRFRANYETLMAQGNEKGAKALMALQTQMQGIGPELGQATRDLASGAANTDAARKLMASTGGAAQDIIERLKSGQIDQYQAAKELQDASRRTGDAARENARYVDKANSAFIDFAQQADLNNAVITENGQMVKKTQAEQTAGGDKLTDATVSAQQNLEQMNRKMQRLGFELMPQAAIAVEKFTGTLNNFIDWVGEKLGIEMPGTKGGPRSAVEANQQAKAMAKQQGAGWLGQQWAGMKAGASYTFGGAGGGGAHGISGAGDYSGLKIKSAESTAGGEANPKLLELAKLIQNDLGGDLKYFSAFNDKFHMDRNSKHNQGTALDFTLNDPSKAAEIAAKIKGYPGVSNVIDEYANPSNGATAGHIHAEISARNGFSGMISGPSSGYRPNLTMHGTEAISIQPNPNTGSTSPNSDSGIMAAQLSRLEELVSVMKQQVSISSKILSYSS
jgi:hypothetical protein